jgi:hypothetical protein
MTRPVGQKISLTKIDAAEAQLREAVRMFFDNRDLVPIYTLANAVREVVAQIGDHLEVATVQKEVAKARGKSVAELFRPLVKIANFFKHADRDPTAKIKLEENNVEVALFMACHDFGRVTAPPQPSEFRICLCARNRS